MAVYKVPQDVEAEDKLLGPFSFKQFVFILITIGSMYVAYLFFLVSPLLVIFPLPFILFFGILGLWPRKDQPVEVYLAAVIRFYLKPRKRIWNQEGHLDLVQITAPKIDERTYTDGLSRTEVHSRLKTLASTMDSRGWASKNVDAQDMTSYAPSQVQQSDRLVMPQVMAPLAGTTSIPNSDDILDPVNNAVASHFDALSQATTENARQAAIASMKEAQVNEVPAIPVAQPPQSYVQERTDPYQSTPQSNDDSTDKSQTSPAYNPYPNIQQSVLQPIGHDETVTTTDEPTKIPATTKDQSTAILNLANNSDLNVSTIAREAEKALRSDDVIQLH